MQGGSHDRDQEAVVEVTQKLGANHGVSDLHHGVAEFQRVHEEHEGRHAHPVLPPQGMPVVSSNFNLPGQRGVEGAEARGQHLTGGREALEQRRRCVDVQKCGFE